MANSLIVVESPTKVKTIKKFLGSDFNVVASMGHIKDLPKSTLGIDLEKDFEPTYKVIEAKKKTIDELKKAAQTAENSYLAPDPDREGEAIAWHISELVKGKRGIKGKNMQRVVFYEITQSAVREAVAHPREISQPLVNAQQARRALDYLVGFNLSPLLWRTLRPGVSAGGAPRPAPGLSVS